MTTIQMPMMFQGAVKSMCEDAIQQAVANLSDKYSFDREEAMRHLNLSDMKVVVGAGGKSKSKKTTDSPKAKRGPTGYLLFASKMRTGVKEELVAALKEGEKIKPQEIVSKVAAMWSALGDEEKAVWNKQAKEEVPKEEVPKEEAPKNSETDSGSSDSEEEVKSVAIEEIKYEKKEKKEKETPKKKTSGYLMFSKDQRASVKEELSKDSDEKVPPAKIISELAKRWKALSTEEQEEWNETAKSENNSDSE